MMTDPDHARHLSVDVKRTRAYYEKENADDYCDCSACINYRKRIAAVFPEIAAYLLQLGIDIAKPFHLSYLKPENGMLKYINCFYVAFGSMGPEWHKEIGKVEIIPGAHFPDPHVEGPFIVFEIWQIDVPYDDEDAKVGKRTWFMG